MIEPRENNIFEHVKTGNQYIVKFFAYETSKDRDGKKVVVYERWRPDAVVEGPGAGPFVRDMGEFCDGRFKLAHAYPPEWE